GYSDPLINARMNPAADPFCFDEAVENAMRHEVELARVRRDSVGGRVSCVISGVPAGLGNPVFGKAQARLAEAMMSLNAVKAFEYGAGSQVSGAYGSESIDEFAPGFKPFPFTTNHQGGILGGITSGMSIYFNLHFKPTPTLPRPVNMADAEGNISEILVGGRHDPCVALRAPVIVEALAALTIADLMLLSHESLV
ncbi:MAG: chorismate synthase, partial [Muribaculaceae bacterium]|nr:chorismate synthase [Muribaculaceae bacterium]